MLRILQILYVTHKDNVIVFVMYSPKPNRLNFCVLQGQRQQRAIDDCQKKEKVRNCATAK